MRSGCTGIPIMCAPSMWGNTVTKDLSEYMTEDGTYDYEVRAVGKDRSDAKYRKSSEYTRSTDRILEDMGRF